MTLNFNQRVQEFIKNIIMDKESPLAIQYYNYRIEFQMRGMCIKFFWADQPTDLPH